MGSVHKDVDDESNRYGIWIAYGMGNTLPGRMLEGKMRERLEEEN